MKIGIIRETKKPHDKRTALSPEHCKILVEDPYNFNVVVQPSAYRCFTDEEYRNAGVSVDDDVTECDILIGVKEVEIATLIPNKTYFFFSHTIKKQAYNRKLLLAALEKNIKLIDYETLKDHKGKRLIAFGHFAGMVGAHNALWTYGNRTELFDIPRMKDVVDYNVAKRIYKSTIFSPVKIVLTGSGRVADGALTVLRDMGIREIPPALYLHKSHFNYPVFTHISSLEYVKHKENLSFTKDYFYEKPQEFINNFEEYSKNSDIFINCIYWDDRSPKFFDLDEINNDQFRVQVIADVTCDIAPLSSVPTTIRASTIKDPVYGIDRKSKQETRPFLDSSIDIMAIDNLPNELPKDASRFFSEQFIHTIIPELYKGDRSEILKRATIVNNGELTTTFNYLQDYVGQH